VTGPVPRSGGLLARRVAAVPSTVEPRQVRERITAYYATYAAGDVAGREALFADDCVFEDPAGCVVASDKKSLHEFFVQMVRPDWSIEFRLDRIAVVGNEAIATTTMTFVVGERRPTFVVINSHFVFDDSGRITRMRAFFDADAMSDVDPG
jgi:steroid Delta-isomerase